jgi:hypothetical protein
MLISIMQTLLIDLTRWNYVAKKKNEIQNTISLCCENFQKENSVNN